MTMELNPSQEEAVGHGDGPLLIIAGAGSGKTRTLTSRLKALLERGVPPEHIIAITFTNKAAGEMRSRISSSTNNELVTNKRMWHSGFVNSKRDSLFVDGNAPFIGTFHSLGARILRENAAALGRTKYYSIYDDDDTRRALKAVIKEADFDLSPALMRSKIGAVKNELADPRDMLDNRMLKIFRAYEKLLAQHNAFDFDDLIEKVVRLWEARSAILEEYRRRWQHVLVDEFQDVNTSQYQMVWLLCAQHQNLSVVGDDAQSIFKFRGSDFRNFLNFERDWPKARVVVLDQNYRSTKTILAAASEVIKRNVYQKPKRLWTENEEGGLIRIVAAEDGEEEASCVAETIQQLRGHVPRGGTTVNESRSATGIQNSSTHQLKAEGRNSSTAVLYRTNAQSRAIEQELIMREIPYRIFGGITFYARKEVKDIVAALRVVANPADAISAGRIREALPKRSAEATLTALREADPKLPPFRIVDVFLKSSGYFEMLGRKFENAPERIENINELIAYAGEFETLDAFLERVSLLQSSDIPSKTLVASGYTLNPIHLMTIHLAKGLEFDRVFVIGASEGLLPHQMSYGSPDEIEEERRLMYVAMTRARKTLHLSFWGTPSRFLLDIPGDLTEVRDLRDNRRGGGGLGDEDTAYIEY